jgi:tetratricopeptide (TPR) repeat protein
MRTLLAFAIVAGLSASAAADDADSKAKAAAEFAEGQRLYDANNYAAAVVKFKAAWELDHDPAYLFNIAQALRFAKQCGESADYYRKFLAQVTSAPNLDKVHEYLAEVDACAKTQQPQPQQPQPLPPQPEHPQGSSGTGKLGLLVGGAGIVALGVGIYFNYKALHLTSQHDHDLAQCTTEVPCSPDQLQTIENTYGPDGRRDEKLGIAFDVVGGAAITAGVLLYMFRDRGAEQPPVAFTPTHGGAMVTTGWSF